MKFPVTELAQSFEGTPVLTFILVMAKFDCTLWELLKGPSSDRLTIDMRILILSKILDGLIHIQENNLVHLDIKG